MKKTLLIVLEESLKEKFYTFARELKITPMRTIIILIQMFVAGKINAKEVIAEYNVFFEKISKERLKHIKENRISGGLAYKISQENKLKN